MTKACHFATALLAALTIGARAHAAVAIAVTTAPGAVYGLQVMSWRDIPFRTIVRQQYDYSCGSAALATLLRYHYGRNVGEAEIFKAMYEQGDQAKIRKVGFSLLDMKRYLQAEGILADGYRLTLEELISAPRPAIAVIKVGPYRHFVVIKGVSDHRILIGDPALGLKIYSLAQFQAMWDGVVFALHEGGGLQGAFNQASEWRPWASSTSAPAMTDDSLSRLTWAMPSLYQLAPVIQSVASVPLAGAP